MMHLFFNARHSHSSSFCHFSFLLCLAFLSTVFSQYAFSNSDLDKSLNLAKQMITEGQKSQAFIDKTLDETNSLDAEFKQLSRSLEQININLAHQKQIHQQQEEQIISLASQLDEVSNTENSIVPLMLKMIDWLDEHVESDIPFHLDERRRRISKIKQNILSPDLPLADIYRSVLEAYQIENDFGYNIESYQQSIELNGQILESQILRIGRVGLYYLSFDGTQGGFWDKQAQQWKSANSATLHDIQQGMLIAKKQLPHKLLALPLSVGDK